MSEIQLEGYMRLLPGYRPYPYMTFLPSLDTLTHTLPSLDTLTHTLPSLDTLTHTLPGMSETGRRRSKLRPRTALRCEGKFRTSNHMHIGDTSALPRIPSAIRSSNPKTLPAASPTADSTYPME